MWRPRVHETAAYSVVKTDGDVELRRYPEMTLAQVTRAGTRRKSVQSGFSPLARYIFAKDRTGEKIAMTAPAVQKPINDKWTISFILPSGVSAEDAPKPSGDVAIVTEPGRLMAIIRFSGVWSEGASLKPLIGCSSGLRTRASVFKVHLNMDTTMTHLHPPF